MARRQPAESRQPERQVVGLPPEYHHLMQTHNDISELRRQPKYPALDRNTCLAEDSSAQWVYHDSFFAVIIRLRVT